MDTAPPSPSSHDAKRYDGLALMQDVSQRVAGVVVVVAYTALSSCGSDTRLGSFDPFFSLTHSLTHSLLSVHILRPSFFPVRFDLIRFF